MFSIHPQASKAAEAAECAGEQGQYWEMHDALFGNQEQWSGDANAVDTFKELAGGLDLDQTQFGACLDEERYADKILADYQEGTSQGISSTPTFLINGAPLSGAQPFSAFQQQIEFYLAGGEAPKLEVAADSFRSLGDADAPVVITEFSDYQCPACAYAEQEVVPGLIEQYVDTGKVRFVYREFPLENLHPNARRASEAAVCAGLQDGYWEMHSTLFATSEEWEGLEDPTDQFKSYAADQGLDAQAFEACLDSGEGDVVVQGDMLAAQTLGVQATPTFFVNDLLIQGGRGVEAMGWLIDYAATGAEFPDILPQPDDMHVRGDPDSARAITVGFVDFSSPDSATFARDVLPTLVSDYIDAGTLIYVLHPWWDGAEGPGTQAATAAECAGEQGEYWEMHDLLFEEQETWLSADDRAAQFGEYAQSLDLDAGAFEACLTSEVAATRVLAGNVVGARYGVEEAPIFLFNNGQALQGSPTLEEFESMVNSIVNQ